MIREEEEYLCPFCYGQSFELEALIKHVDDEHAYQQRSAVSRRLFGKTIFQLHQADCLRMHQHSVHCLCVDTAAINRSFACRGVQSAASQ